MTGRADQGQMQTPTSLERAGRQRPVPGTLTSLERAGRQRPVPGTLTSLEREGRGLDRQRPGPGISNVALTKLWKMCIRPYHFQGDGILDQVMETLCGTFLVPSSVALGLSGAL